MALWLKNYLKKYKWDLLFSLVLTAVLMFPYMIRSFTPVEHDTFFHLSRIENLSRAIKDGNFFPAIYPYENNGFGYASSLFYNDLFLIPSALLRLAGVPLALCYRINVIIAVYISSLTMMSLVRRIYDHTPAVWLSAAAYLFSNYHITDIYVRGALGEIFALAALPAMLCAMYRILHDRDTEGWFTLALSLGALALCHNLTFVLGVFLFILVFGLYLDALKKDIFVALLKGVGFAFLISAFFTLPMLEQLGSQSLVVHYFASGSDLSAYSMDLWQYFANTTVFAVGGNARPHDATMVVNVGYFLEFAPLLYLFVKKENKNRLITFALISGYLMILLPCSLVPWKYLYAMRILQFPWRLNTLGILLLSIPAAIGVNEILGKKPLVFACIAVLSAECVWHVRPVLARTFGMDDTTTWQNVLDGQLCDPCYSADYVRVELAGGDYLPWPHPDYRTQTRKIMDASGNELDIEYSQRAGYFSFTLNKEIEEELILPLTWYNGYKAYKTDKSFTMIETGRTDDGLLKVRNAGKGDYFVLFEDTALRRLSSSLSIMGFVFMILIRSKMNWWSEYMNAINKRKKS